MRKLIGLMVFVAMISLRQIASAEDSKDIGEMIATAINLSGNLCAQVVSVVPLKVGGGDKVFEVECVEYRGGRGTVRYILDTRNGSVAKAR
jgi:hypothetical protein